MHVVIVSYKIKNPADCVPEEAALVDPDLKHGWN